jgi:hypothetical protein
MEALLMIGAAALAGIATFAFLQKRAGGDCPA